MITSQSVDILRKESFIRGYLVWTPVQGEILYKTDT